MIGDQFALIYVSVVCEDEPGGCAAAWVKEMGTMGTAVKIGIGMLAVILLLSCAWAYHSHTPLRGDVQQAVRVSIRWSHRLNFAYVSASVHARPRDSPHTIPVAIRCAIRSGSGIWLWVVEIIEVWKVLNVSPIVSFVGSSNEYY